MASGNGEMPNRDQLMKVIETSQAAQRAQSAAQDLRSQAEKITDSGQREQMLKEAFDKEVEANGLSKTAKRLQSGTWQGLGFGGGIGAATALGLGAGVGTLLGTILTVPVTGLGMLIGSGVGALHGPWIKLGGKEQKFEDADPNEIVNEIEKNQMPQRVTSEAQYQEHPSAPTKTETPAQSQAARRKPKKIEIRSQAKSPAIQNASPETSTVKPKGKPKKIEVRSGGKTTQ